MKTRTSNAAKTREEQQAKVYNLSANILDGKSRGVVRLSDTLATVLVVNNKYLYANDEIYFPTQEWTFSENARVAVKKDENGDILWGELQ